MGASIREMPRVNEESPKQQQRNGRAAITRRKPFSRQSGSRRRKNTIFDGNPAFTKRSSSLPDNEFIICAHENEMNGGGLFSRPLLHSHNNTSTAPVSSASFSSHGIQVSSTNCGAHSCSSSPSRSNYPSYKDLTDTVQRKNAVVQMCETSAHSSLKRSLSMGDTVSVVGDLFIGAGDPHDYSDSKPLIRPPRKRERKKLNDTSMRQRSRDRSLSAMRRSLQTSIKESSPSTSITRVWRRLTSSFLDTPPYNDFADMEETSPSPSHSKKSSSLLYENSSSLSKMNEDKEKSGEHEKFLETPTILNEKKDKEVIDADDGVDIPLLPTRKHIIV